MENAAVFEELTFETLDGMLGRHAPFLVSLSDGAEEELRIVICPAEPGEPGGDHSDALEGFSGKTRQALKDILAGARPIGMDESRLFEITFRDYILCQIRSESFCSLDRTGIRRGDFLITFEKSALLSHLNEFSDARQWEDGSFYPGRWVHYGICTQNHIIDVVSHCPPEILRRR